MPPSLRLVSINIERSKHLELVLPFLEKMRPDVICIQELLQRDISRFESVLGFPFLFSPGMKHLAEGQPDIMGIAVGTRFPILNHTNVYYAGDPTTITTG